MHTNEAQQQLMVEILNQCFKGLLVPEPDDKNPAAQLPTLLDLKRKVLIKVKYSPPSNQIPPAAAPLATQEVLGRIPTETDTSYSSSENEAYASKDKSKKKKAKVSKITEALSRMGIYTKSCHFSTLASAEAKMPAHVFSLSEGALTGMYKEDPEGLFNHNKQYLMRAYPKGTRISSSNLDPSIFWRAGVQMVALNWQKVDRGMMLQEAMFQGTGGWAMKPASYLSQATFEESRAYKKLGMSWLNIEILSGQNIPIPSDTTAEHFRPYVKCEVHIDTPDQEEKSHGSKTGKSKNPLKTVVGPSKGQHPEFKEGSLLSFKDLPAIIPALSFVR